MVLIFLQSHLLAVAKLVTMQCIFLWFLLLSKIPFYVQPQNVNVGRTSVVISFHFRLVTVHSRRRGKLFDRRTGKSEFKFSIGADFLNRDVTGRV